MDVRFTEEQNLLRRSARDFLASNCPIAVVRHAMEDGHGTVEALWQQIVALGWTGLTVEEESGGSGLGLLDLCVLLEETGAALLPVPLLSTTAIGASGVARSAHTAQRRARLAAIVDGSLRLALAQLESSGGWENRDIRLTAARDGDTLVLSGSKLYVRDAAVASGVIVPARVAGEDGIALVLVDAGTAGVTIEPTRRLDLTRSLATVRFDRVRIEPPDVLATTDAGERILAEVHDTAKIALCAEMLGGARRVLDLSVEYAKTREQFGSPIGRFQAIQHKCANMLVLLESARSATYYAAWALDNREPDSHVAACMAKAYVSEAYGRIAGDGIQIHGGMGFTWEADLHLYYKRAKADELAFGSPAFNRELAARELIDGRR